jgi:hypothetical protein
MGIQNSTTMKSGPALSLTMDQSSIWKYLMPTQKKYSKLEWKLTKDGLWTMQLADKITLTSRNPLIYFSDQM